MKTEDRVMVVVKAATGWERTGTQAHRTQHTGHTGTQEEMDCLEDIPCHMRARNHYGFTYPIVDTISNNCDA
jgi:hypothetical protein